MSAAVISFGAELGIQGSGSVQSNDSGTCVDAHSAKARSIRTSTTVADRELCCEAATEVDLVSAAKGGNHLAFAELCRRYRPSLERRIRHIVRNFEDAEDVLQETLMSAFRHVAGFRADCSFHTWILTIATNTSLMLLRKRRKHPETGFGLVTAEGKEVEVLQLIDPMPNPEQVYAKLQASQRVSDAVRMLRPRFRLIVERYHRDELKLVDAANATGITEAAAKSRLLRARKVLRRQLKNDDGRYLD